MRLTHSLFLQFLDKVGVVHRITDKGDVRVQYEGYATRWTIHPQALARVTSYSPGDVVTVISDVAKVKEYQKGHGEWIEYMIGVSNCDIYCFLLILLRETLMLCDYYLR